MAHYTNAKGQVFKTGLNPEGPRMKLAPTYAAAYPVIDPKDYPRKCGGLRDYFPFDWNQNPQSSCGGHGSTTAFNAAWNFQGETLHEFSPDYTYSLCNGGRDEGSMPDELLDALTLRGTCLRSTVGHGQIYRGSYDTAKADAEAARFKADAVLTVGTEGELITAVLRRQAAYTGVMVDESYFNPDAKGRVRHGGNVVGGHCTAQIGEYEYMDDLNSGGIWTRGSWGKGYGLDGWVWTPMSYFRIGFQSFRGCVVIAAKRDPQEATPHAVAA